MKLFIARHGQASFNNEVDGERPLTAVGRRATESLFETYREQLMAVDRLWVSPLRRAQQTAEILSGYRPERIETHDELEPDEEPLNVLSALERVSIDSSVMLVSHQPLVGDLVSLICHGNLFDPHPFVTSEIVVIDLEQPVPGLGRIIGDLLP
jgi:phosphohistidine phosphatase